MKIFILAAIVAAGALGACTTDDQGSGSPTAAKGPLPPAGQSAGKSAGQSGGDSTQPSGPGPNGNAPPTSSGL